ncbi:MAG TPA: hypothetical protein VJN42_07405 [Candidatus Acidoferrum sp.]|nr:hypothetical protein [Candidatus Acidoferrum sp.]
MAEAAERSEPGVKRATKLIASALSNALIYAVPLFAAPVVKHQDQRKLPGYQAYTQKVRFRLIPYLW